MGLNSTEVAYGFGQMGSGHLKTATDFFAPTGKIIVAITALEDITFHATNGLVADDSFLRTTTDASLEDGVAFIGTQDQVLANGEDDDGDTVTSVKIANTVVFPKGITIYGRWTRCKLSTSFTHGIIIYFASKR
tara:strand:- start:1026 stop:1427 length:402 start_codon:yes stop_codon:yes gene_type:complete